MFVDQIFFINQKFWNGWDMAKCSKIATRGNSGRLAGG